MNNSTAFGEHTGAVEVRGMIKLRQVFKERSWPFPYYYKLDGECTSLELANLLELPLDLVESVFINGKAYPLGEGLIKPGDRVAFVSPGMPGPYRVLLGIKKLDH